MAQRSGNAIVFAVAMLAIVQAVAAKDYTVGDTNEWTYPPGTDTTYCTNTWAAKYTFAPGDKLIFKYAVGAHDVQVVSASEYTRCLTSSGISYSSGSDTIPLPKAGDYYFICSFIDHSDQGMKLKVTVIKVAAVPTPAVAPVALPPAVAPVTPPPVKAPTLQKPPLPVPVPPPLQYP